MKSIITNNKHFDFLPEGTKVKLDYDEIHDRPNYSKRNERFIKFVEQNKDRVFTVEYDDKHKDKPYLVCLNEDTTKPKWLFHANFDLIVVKE